MEEKEQRNVSVIKDADGNNIVMIPLLHSRYMMKMEGYSDITSFMLLS